MENAFVLLVLEAGASWLVALVVTFVTFWVYNRISPVQKVILPGRDEAEAVDNHLSTMEVGKWTNKEISEFHSLSIRDAARIIAAALYFYTIAQIVSPLF